MPVSIGGKRIGPADDHLLDRLAALWTELDTTVTEIHRLQAKRERQEAWLDDNSTDPRWNDRRIAAKVTQIHLDTITTRVHEIANDANKIVEKMDVALRCKARDAIHAWAGTGNVGMYAALWKIEPEQGWQRFLDDAYGTAEHLRSTVAVPF